MYTSTQGIAQKRGPGRCNTEETAIHSPCESYMESHRPRALAPLKGSPDSSAGPSCFHQFLIVGHSYWYRQRQRHRRVPPRQLQSPITQHPHAIGFLVLPPRPPWKSSWHRYHPPEKATTVVDIDTTTHKTSWVVWWPLTGRAGRVVGNGDARA